MKIIFILCFLSVAVTHAVEINSIFKDNMVLQRNHEVAIYGTAEPSSRVTVSFKEQTKYAEADSSGRWGLKLSPMSKSFESGVLTVKSSSSNRVVAVKNILIGDVWLCSGQSNMEYTLGQLPLLRESVQNIDVPGIRGFVVEHRESGRPDEAVVAKRQFKAAWREMKSPWAAHMSATAYYFAAKLRKDLDVPIGLVVSAVGGSQIQRWMPKEVVEGLGLDSESSGGAGAFYNTMIYPIRDFTFNGVIWYQGESNGRIPHSYYTLSNEHIKCWREIWKVNNSHLKDMPFLTVQIAPFDPGVDGLKHDAWAYIRDAQLKTLLLPNTGLVVTTDVGEYADIHPQNKQPVGQRLALWAEKLEGLPVEPSGPLYKGVEVEGNKMKVFFTHTGSGLETRRVAMASKRSVLAKDDPDAYIIPENTLAGFSICGKDRIFVPADARILDGYVEVFSRKVLNPIAVRYGWSTFPLCNLYNKEGLPASPFRSDNFRVPDVQGRKVGRQWNKVSRDLGSSLIFTGSNPETKWKYAELEGVIGYRPENGQEDPIYAYYKVEGDDFDNGKLPKVVISVTYFDNCDGFLDLLYDSSDSSVDVVEADPGAWKLASKIKLANTGRWSVAEVSVDDAFFAGRCNGGDIRINCSYKSTILGPVFCRKQEGVVQQIE